MGNERLQFRVESELILAVDRCAEIRGIDRYRWIRAAMAKAAGLIAVDDILDGINIGGDTSLSAGGDTLQNAGGDTLVLEGGDTSIIDGDTIVDDGGDTPQNAGGDTLIDDNGETAVDDGDTQ